MAIPLGAFVYGTAHDLTQKSTSEPSSFNSASRKSDRPTSAPRSSSSHGYALTGQHGKSVRKRGKGLGLHKNSAPPTGPPIRRSHDAVNRQRTNSEHSAPARSSCCCETSQLPYKVYEPVNNSPQAVKPRPKHIPIVIPEYATLAAFAHDNGGFARHHLHPSPTSANSTPSLSDFPTPKSVAGREPPPIVAGYSLPFGTTFSKTRHVEIKIPEWAQPVLKQPVTPPQVTLRDSVFRDPFASANHFFPSIHLDRITGLIETGTMGSTQSPTQLYANRSNSGSNAYLNSVHGSQTSLSSMEQDFDSISDTESMRNEASHDASQTPSQVANVSPISAQTPPAVTPNTTQQLSGLVCNVHRTTGKEPHPLVGATTTVVGDSLFVFGGRRLSRSKPQLTSTLYELDLVRRHWARVDAKGDIPPPRYFHSVCALGDTKLVCYGGMSPATPDAGQDVQSEVVVMSDIHIYDVPSKTWTRISTLDSPQGRYAHCAAILPSSAFFASADAPTSALQHNPQGSKPNQGSLGVAIDGAGGAEMIVVGGQDSSNHYIEQVSVFNLRSLKWTSTTDMNRSCGAYRSVVCPLTSMNPAHIGAGTRAHIAPDEDEEEAGAVGSGAPMLIYSNYNFLDVKLELQIRLTDGSLSEKHMQGHVSPPGLRFPNGGVIANHFVVSGTFLTSSKQEYALWALDLSTLTWSRIDAGGNIFSQGSWNRGVLWQRRNAFVILGNRKRSLVDDYNNRRINFSNICLVELEAFGLYDNPRSSAPMSGYVSASANLLPRLSDITSGGRNLGQAAEELGVMSMTLRELADMDILAIDGTRIPVNSRLIARRWGSHFTSLLRETLAASTETDTVTLRPSGSSIQASRNSSITITNTLDSEGTTVTNNSATTELPDVRTVPPPARPRLLYLPHTAPTLQALIHFLYTSTLPKPPHPLATPQIFCSLLQFARPYSIDGLLEAVVERLHESLDGRNAAAIFNAAAMGAGGGEGVQFVVPHEGNRASVIPMRAGSSANSEGAAINGAGARGSGLRIDTDMANGRSTRNTLRPGQSLTTAGVKESDEEEEEDVPQSAHTDTSMSEDEASLSSMTPKESQEIWNGTPSAVVGLQKRGLRGLMEGRRMRERGRSNGVESGQVGLGIA